MFGKFVSKVISAPFRVAALPERLFNAVDGNRNVKNTMGDEIANKVEKVTRKTLDGK